MLPICFTAPLTETDPEVADVIRRELGRQRGRDRASLPLKTHRQQGGSPKAQGSVLTNKYAEGLPGRRLLRAAANMWT